MKLFALIFFLMLVLGEASAVIGQPKSQNQQGQANQQVVVSPPATPSVQPSVEQPKAAIARNETNHAESITIVDERSPWPSRIANIISALLLLFVGYQAYINKGMLKSMQDNERFLDTQCQALGKQAVAMQGQLEAIEKQAGFMETQTKAALRQAEIMKSSLVLGTRAYVGVHDINFNPHQKRILLQIENIGRVPAKNIEVTIELMIRIPDHLMPPPDPDGARRGWGFRAPRERIIANVDPALFDYWELRIPWLNPFGRTKLFPGSLKLGIVIRLDEIFYITPSQYQSITAGNAQMFVRGVIIYSDGFHSGKRTEFAFRYYLKDNLWIAIPDTGFDLFHSEPEKPDADYNPT